ncbi:hypothetical protein DFH09DRAFT_1300168 [Mycena vulgaris]|nr:hypothetical protein DFH09DRAFT_1300168 [Mycena vulgaris]
MSSAAGGAEVSERDRVLPRQAEKALKEAKAKMAAQVKVPLLGSSDSGKSMILKQMCLIHCMPFSPQVKPKPSAKLVFDNRTRGLKYLDALPDMGPESREGGGEGGEGKGEGAKGGRRGRGSSVWDGGDTWGMRTPGYMCATGYLLVALLGGGAPSRGRVERKDTLAVRVRVGSQRGGDRAARPMSLADAGWRRSGGGVDAASVDAGRS